MKKVLLVLVMALLSVSFVVAGGGAEAADDAYDVRVIIKATDSDYYQTFAMGAEAKAADSNGTIKVTVSGPASEIDVDEQVAILENAIAAEPDAIVLTSGSADATVPAVEDAIAQGIPVITVDNKLNTTVYTSFLATDHYAAAGIGAEEMVKEWDARGINPSGKSVFIMSSVAGTTVNTARVEGFSNKIKELVPSINVLEVQYADNDIATATDITLNTIAANEDLVGIFGDNNHMGIGVANAISETEMQDEIVSIAFDSSPDEIAAVEEGLLTGIIVQNPFGMAYTGVEYAITVLEGGSVPKDIAFPITFVTKENINEPEVQSLLYPGQ